MRSAAISKTVVDGGVFVDCGKGDGHVNKLYFGDNLEVLKRIESSSVDLVYLDPPFNSKETYNVLYKSPI